jgi:outer membrane immunogenic protein
MKSLFIAATAAGVLLCAAPAFAQSTNFNPTYYGTLGYNNFNSDNGSDLSAVTGRLGARLTPYLGAEGEVSVGVGGDHTDIANGSQSVHLNDQYAGYAVGYVPLKTNLDLFARVGFGHTDLHTSSQGVAADVGADSWNFGAGGQYFFDHANGVRAEYTREDYQCSHCDGADVWSVAYVRKF